MDIGLTSKKQSYLSWAALALILVGLLLSFFTWQNLQRQRDTIEEHLFLASQSILRGIETSLMREVRGHMRGMRGMMSRRGFFFPDSPSLKPRIREMFTELVTASDVRFIAFHGPDGEPLIEVLAEDDVIRPELPAQAWRSLRLDGTWAAMYSDGEREVFVAGAQTRPGLGRLCSSDPDLDCGVVGPPFLIVGLNPGRQLQNFTKYRRTAILQTVYALAVAMFMWGLAAAYLKRRNQSRELHRLERFHFKLLDAMPDGLVTLGGDGVIRAANPAAKTLLADGKDLVGQRWSDLPLEQDCSDADGERRKSGFSQYACEGRHLEVLEMPLPKDASASGQGDESLVLLRDRTKLRALEEDLGEARRLAAVGHLAAGLAHEIRNPLSALRGFAQFFKKKLAGKKPEEQYAETMVREADRLDKVITDLLFLSRPRTPEKAEVDLSALYGELVDLTRFDLERTGMTFISNLELPVAHADPDMLKQALLNLVLNSAAAMDEPQSAVIEMTSFKRDGMMVVGISDNGRGMTSDERDHALEPFFTSKKDGTGLGLAMVHRIARDHGGHVEIETQTEGEGRGTAVRLVLPSAEGEDSSEQSGEE